MKVRVCISLDSETLSLIDGARGLIKRSNFVEEIVRRSLKAEGTA